MWSSISRQGFDLLAYSVFYAFESTYFLGRNFCKRTGGLLVIWRFTLILQRDSTQKWGEFELAFVLIKERP